MAGPFKQKSLSCQYPKDIGNIHKQSGNRNFFLLLALLLKEYKQITENHPRMEEKFIIA